MYGITLTDKATSCAIIMCWFWTKASNMSNTKRDCLSIRIVIVFFFFCNCRNKNKKCNAMQWNYICCRRSSSDSDNCEMRQAMPFGYIFNFRPPCCLPMIHDVLVPSSAQKCSVVLSSACLLLVIPQFKAPTRARLKQRNRESIEECLGWGEGEKVQPRESVPVGTSIAVYSIALGIQMGNTECLWLEIREKNGWKSWVKLLMLLACQQGAINTLSLYPVSYGGTISDSHLDSLDLDSQTSFTIKLQNSQVNSLKNNRVISVKPLLTDTRTSGQCLGGLDSEAYELFDKKNHI